MNEKSNNLGLIIFLIFGLVSMVAGVVTRHLIWIPITIAMCGVVTWVTSSYYYTKGLKDAEGFAAGIDIFKDESGSFPVLQVDYNREAGYTIIMLGLSWTGVKIAIVPSSLIVGWKPGDLNPTDAGLDDSGEKVLLSRHTKK